MVAAVWLTAYFPVAYSIAEAWLDNGSYSHGFIALAFSLYIAWQQRRKLRPAGTLNWLALGALLGLSLVWWLGSTANVLKVEQLAVFLVLIMSLVLMFGWSILRILKYPFIIVLLVIPVWDFIQEPLQSLSAWVTLQILQGAGIPVLVQGFEFTVPGGRFVVEEACSGLGFLLTAVMLAVFYGYLNHLDRKSQVVLVTISILIALVANWIRITSIMLIGNRYGMDHMIVTDHLMFGWIVFAIALIPFFWISYRFFPQQVRVETTVTRGIDSVPVRIVGFAVVAIAILPVTGFLLAGAGNGSLDLSLPDTPAEFIVQDRRAAGVEWQPVFTGASQTTMAAYRYHGRPFDALLVSYREQAQGRELINVNNRLYSEQWRSLEEDTLELGSADRTVRRLELVSTRGEKRTLIYWYIINGVPASDSFRAKFLELKGAFRPDRSAILVALSFPDSAGMTMIREVSDAFYRWFSP